MRETVEKKLDKIKLNTAAFKVLSYLSFKDKAMKPSEIAEGIRQNPSTVRARIAELKNTGLIISSSKGYVSTVNPYDILMKLYREIKEENSG